MQPTPVNYKLESYSFTVTATPNLWVDTEPRHHESLNLTLTHGSTVINSFVELNIVLNHSNSCSTTEVEKIRLISRQPPMSQKVVYLESEKRIGICLRSGQTCRMFELKFGRDHFNDVLLHLYQANIPIEDADIAGSQGDRSSPEPDLRHDNENDYQQNHGVILTKKTILRLLKDAKFEALVAETDMLWRSITDW